MKTNNRWIVVAAAVLALGGGLAAQRGAGRGRATIERPASTAFDSAEYRITFPVPSGFDLYTPEEPGRYRPLFAQRHIAFLVNPMQSEESIAIRFSGNLTEADLEGYREAMERNPPQARLPNYEKVSVGSVKIGRAGSKDAVDYVYRAKADKLDEVVRQVVFLHQGKGFMITFTVEQKRYEKANKDFTRFLSSLEFR